jgi:hypothetical protein
MATPVTVTKYSLRMGSPMPASPTGGGRVSKYVIQTFGVEVSKIDNWEAITGLYPSEVMQGLQDYPEIGTNGIVDLTDFVESSYVRISYTGTDVRDTDGNMIFKGTEEHSSIWMDEEDSGLIWTR